MGRLNKRFVKKTGHQVPKAILRAMNRLHPNVQIMWNDRAQRWCLVGHDRNGSYLISTISRNGQFAPPMMENTVYFLNRMHPANSHKFSALRQLERDLDATPENDAIRKSKSDQIREGSVALWDRMNNKRVFRVHQ